jgi:autotransporter-associated beta strand protein
MNRVASFGWGLLVFAGACYAGTPPLPVINTNLVLDVTNVVFAGGAFGNGVSNSAAAIQAAINAATGTNVSGIRGASVRLPSNGTLSTYVSGPITLRNNINLLIDSNATLKMLPYTNWISNYGTTTFITGSGLRNVSISGAGTLDGNAGFSTGGVTNNWWQSSGQISRPNFIDFSGCSTVLIEQVTMQNPPTFHIMAKGGNFGLTIRNIRINTDPNSPNTDGMDLASTNVLIYGCYISGGDDNIEIGGSSAPASDITITNCTFGFGHGVSLGSLVNGAGGGVQGLIVSNCYFLGTDYGIRMKSDRDRGGICQNLRYMDIGMTNVIYPIVIYSYYNSVGTPNNITPFRASTDTVHTVTGNTPIWRNITISNLTATNLTGSNISGIIWGVPEMLVSNVTFSKVNFNNAGNKTFCIYNAADIRIVDSNLTAPNTTTNTLTIYNAAITITNSAVTNTVITLGGLASPPTNNVLSFFNRPVLITDTNADGAGLLTLGGSTLAFKQVTVTFSNTLNAVSASTLLASNGTMTIRGALTGPGPLSVTLTNTGALRFNQGTNVWGGSNVVFIAGSAGTINNSAPGNISVLLGALTGGSGARLLGSDQAGAGLDTYVIGSLNSNTTFAGAISNSATHTVALTKIGSATLVLTGTNSYTGGTMVSNGILMVHGIVTGAVTVASGATLSGAGTISGPVTVNGTLAPGGSSGTLTIRNNLVTAGVLQYELGTNSDLTAVTGNLTLGGTLNVSDAGGLTNTTYTLFTYGGTLAYNGLSIGTIPGTNFTYAIDTNTSGQVRLVVGVPSTFPQWQLQYFGCNDTNLCPQAAASSDPDGDSQSNLTEFLAGTDPTNGAAFWQMQAGPTNGLPPLAVNFSENSTGLAITNRLWNFGDGTTGPGQNPSHTYTNAGTFSVTVTLLNYYGTASLVASNLITVLPEAVWTNASASGNWSMPSSWSPVSTPDSGADVIFADAGTTAILDSVSRRVGEITFNRNADFSIAASGGAALTINRGITVAMNHTYRILAPVVLGGTNQWSVATVGVLQVTGAVSGTNSVTKVGDGVLSLSGTNDFSGDTVVSNGVLQIFGAGLMTNTPNIEIVSGAALDVSGRTGGSMTVVSGQILQGNGTILGNLIVGDGAKLSPGGNSVGTLTFLNDLVSSNTATLEFDLGTNSDLLAVSNNLTLNGTLDINDAGGFGPGVYTLMTYGGSLTDNGLTVGTTPGSNLLYTIDTNTAGTVKLDVTLLPTTIAIGAADLQDGSGNLAPSNSVAVLLVDTGNNGFAAPQPGFGLSLGATWGADDQIVGLWDLRGSVDCTGNDGGALCAETIIAYANGIAPGQALQLYWFPSLTLASNVLGVTSYGLYTDPVGIDSSDPWVLPGGGGTLNVIFITTPYGGSNPESAGEAIYSTAIAAPLANFTAGPVNGVEPLPVTFTDASTGTSPLALAWDFGDGATTNTDGGASVIHSYSAGVYTVTLVASNSAGVSTLVSNNLINVVSAFQAWQMQYFGCTGCPQADGNADFDGDGVSNTNEFLTGTDPTNSASAFRILSTVQRTTDVVITWTAAGGHTNVVQAVAGANYTNGFSDISAPIIITGSGDQTTNYVDSGGTTNTSSRYYRVRVVP